MLQHAHRIPRVLALQPPRDRAFCALLYLLEYKRTSLARGKETCVDKRGILQQMCAPSRRPDDLTPFECILGNTTGVLKLGMREVWLGLFAPATLDKQF